MRHAAGTRHPMCNNTGIGTGDVREVDRPAFLVFTGSHGSEIPPPGTGIGAGCHEAEGENFGECTQPLRL